MEIFLCEIWQLGWNHKTACVHRIWLLTLHRPWQNWSGPFRLGFFSFTGRSVWLDSFRSNYNICSLEFSLLRKFLRFAFYERCISTNIGKLCFGARSICSSWFSTTRNYSQRMKSSIQKLLLMSRHRGNSGGQFLFDYIFTRLVNRGIGVRSLYGGSALRIVRFVIGDAKLEFISFFHSWSKPCCTYHF